MQLTLKEALLKGIEAHKAGKVQEADRYYTAILKEQPKHPDANHNMGVLAVGLGKVQEAVPFFKTALDANSSIAQFWLSYIDALIKLNRMNDAKAVFDEAKSKGIKSNGFEQIEKRLIGFKKGTEVNVTSSKSQEPKEGELQSLINLYTQGQFQKALTQGSQLLKDFPNSINLYNIIGASNKGLGKLKEAIEAYNKAISIKPDYAEAYNNMGIALQDQGKLDEAVEACNKALSLEPRFAEAYNSMGIALKDQGKLEEAIEAFNKALSLKPDYAKAYYNMGIALQDQGKLDEAIEAFKKAISIKPDYATAKHLLSALTGITNKTAPREYVENLFDDYAKKFETYLVDKLEYKIPKIIRDILIKPNNNNKTLGSVLDIGCGTGLLGTEIKNHCSKLQGIDLSNKMLTIAKQKNVYDKLSQFDIVEYLSSMPLGFDYYIALDVFIYVGELTEIFRLIKSRNKKPGHLVFSTEHTEKDGYHLLRTSRYSHSKSYIESLCKKFDYNISHFSTTELRKEKGNFLTGGIYILRFKP